MSSKNVRILYELYYYNVYARREGSPRQLLIKTHHQYLSTATFAMDSFPKLVQIGRIHVSCGNFQGQQTLPKSFGT